jgi:hypothetical protein
MVIVWTMSQFIILGFSESHFLISQATYLETRVLSLFKNVMTISSNKGNAN